MNLKVMNILLSPSVTSVTMVMQEKNSDLTNENTENIDPVVPKDQREYSLESILLIVLGLIKMEKYQCLE